ncbi:hypothetical protein H0H81_003590, partial [Sphagnurus paluster]
SNKPVVKTYVTRTRPAAAVVKAEQLRGIPTLTQPTSSGARADGDIGHSSGSDSEALRRTYRDIVASRPPSPTPGSAEATPMPSPHEMAVVDKAGDTITSKLVEVNTIMMVPRTCLVPKLTLKKGLGRRSSAHEPGSEHRNSR